MGQFGLGFQYLLPFEPRKLKELPPTWPLFRHLLPGGFLHQTLNWHNYDNYVTRTGLEQMEFKEPSADPNGYKRRSPALEF